MTTSASAAGWIVRFGAHLDRIGPTLPRWCCTLIKWPIAETKALP
jgi:hypothetical protein